MDGEEMGGERWSEVKETDVGKGRSLPGAGYPLQHPGLGIDTYPIVLEW